MHLAVGITSKRLIIASFDNADKTLHRFNKIEWFLHSKNTKNVKQTITDPFFLVDNVFLYVTIHI